MIIASTAPQMNLKRIKITSCELWDKSYFTLTEEISGSISNTPIANYDIIQSSKNLHTNQF